MLRPSFVMQRAGARRTCLHDAARMLIVAQGRTPRRTTLLLFVSPPNCAPATETGTAFSNSYPWAWPASRDENLTREASVRGRRTVVPRAGAGQQFARGVAPHRPLSRPIVGSTQESLSDKQAPRWPPLPHRYSGEVFRREER